MRISSIARPAAVSDNLDPTAPFRRFLRARRPGPAISVHRGLWNDARPENSRAAIHAAAPLGFVEIDVQLCADGVPVVFHDAVLDRMTEETGPLAQRTARELASLRLRAGAGGAGAARTDQRIPLLQEVLADAGPDTFFDFDAKNPDELEAIAADIAALGGRERGTVKIDVATAADIGALGRLQSRYGIMVMAKVDLSTAAPGLIAELAGAGVGAAEVAFGSMDQLAAACRDGGADLAISTYTLDPVHCMGLSDRRAVADPDAVWGRLADAGVAILMTDRAPELARYLRHRRPPAGQA